MNLVEGRKFVDIGLDDAREGRVEARLHGFESP